MNIEKGRHSKITKNGSKNLILITIDSLRADHMGVYGYKKNTSKNLDLFSKKGRLYLKAYSEGSHTSTSFPTILSFDKKIRKSTIYLSQVLKAHGYDTCGIHSNPFLKKFNIGFDHYIDLEEISSISKEKDNMSLLLNSIQEKFFPARSKRRSFAYELSKLYQAFIAKKRTPYASCEKVNARATEYLETARRPFFLWLHYMDVHMPYTPPVGFRPEINSFKMYILNQKLLKASKTYNSSLISKNEITSLIELYDQSLRYLDSEFAKFIHTIEEIGIDEHNTFFIITSDHGEEFKEYGGIGHNNPNTENIVLRRVPLIFRGPKIVANIVENEVTLHGLCPTILSLLGLPVPDRLRKRVFRALE